MTHMGTSTVRREWIRAQDVADMLGVSVYTVRSWRYRGQGPPAYRMNTAIRYDRAEVEAWHAAKRIRGDGSLRA